MHVGKSFGVKEFIRWTTREIIGLFCLSIFFLLLYPVFKYFNFSFPAYISTILGTAFALVVSFKNNTAYSRMFEANKIYGQIQSTSSFFAAVLVTIKGKDENAIKHFQQQFCNLHIAWLTALRYILREPRVWENSSRSENIPFLRRFCVTQEQTVSFQNAICPYLTPEQTNEAISNLSESASYCLGLQIQLLSSSEEQNNISKEVIKTIFTINSQLRDLQARAIIIKNVPYPRAYESMTIYFRNMFLLSLPLTLLEQLNEMKIIWQFIPYVMIIGWVMMFLEKVGQNNMYPFESGPNDVPVSSISNQIEIEMKKVIKASEVPPKLTIKYDIML